MATSETPTGSENVVPLTRHTSSEPARLTGETAADDAVLTEPQETRHTSSEPAD
jgi:hypothetical protein